MINFLVNIGSASHCLEERVREFSRVKTFQIGMTLAELQKKTLDVKKVERSWASQFISYSTSFLKLKVESFKQVHGSLMECQLDCLSEKAKPLPSLKMLIPSYLT